MLHRDNEQILLGTTVLESGGLADKIRSRGGTDWMHNSSIMAKGPDDLKGACEEVGLADA